MNADQVMATLRAEGYTDTFVWRDGPGAVHPPHTHPGDTAHVVLEGEIAITTLGETRTYRVGERFDVPARQVHAARAGSSGCRYVIGEK